MFDEDRLRLFRGLFAADESENSILEVYKFMIRMGRSNKTEEPVETPKFQENYNVSSSNSYGLRQEIAPSNRAMSESESMARDIKEGRLSGYVGNGTVLTGETTFQAMLRVDGHLTGRVTSENGTLIIGSTGRVDANIIV